MTSHRKQDLRVDAYQPFADFVEERAQTPEGRASLERMGVPDTSGSLSQAEWDVASLYVVLRLTKPVISGPDPMALAFGKVKKAWGSRWDALKGAEKISLVQRCASGQSGWEPPPQSLAVDADFGDDDDEAPLAVDNDFGDDDDEDMLGPASPAYPPPPLGRGRRRRRSHGVSLKFQGVWQVPPAADGPGVEFPSGVRLAAQRYFSSGQALSRATVHNGHLFLRVGIFPHTGR